LFSSDRIPMNFGVHKLWEGLKPHESMLITPYTYLRMCCLNFSSYELIDFWYPNDVMFILLNLLMMYEPCICVEILVCQHYSASMFVGIISGKPSRDFTRPLGIPTYLSMCCLNFWYPDDVMFILLNLLMMYEPCICVEIRVCQQHSASMFVGIISDKPSRDFTRPLGSPRGLKGLLYTLNAIVSPTKTDLCFLLWFYFSFCFANGLAKCKFGGIWWVSNIVYLDPLIHIC